jgi:IS5 family transposase
VRCCAAARSWTTLIDASPSTKNAAASAILRCAPRRGNQWHFGMKAHIGVDAKSGLVHTAGVTSGSVHDAKVMPRLLRADDTAVYGDKGYASGAKKRDRRSGKVRAKVEHVCS